MSLAHKGPVTILVLCSSPAGLADQRVCHIVPVAKTTTYSAAVQLNGCRTTRPQPARVRVAPAPTKRQPQQPLRQRQSARPAILGCLNAEGCAWPRSCCPRGRRLEPTDWGSSQRSRYHSIGPTPSFVAGYANAGTRFLRAGFPTALGGAVGRGAWG